MLLAGDIGGTKTLLGLFDRHTPRPVRERRGSFRTAEFRDLGDIVETFLEAERVRPDDIEAAAFGAAGPVVEGRVRLTNVGWTIDAGAIARRFQIRDVRIMNDLQATLHSVPVLAPDELHVLQEGRPAARGNIAIIAAGTGLGMSMALEVGGVYRPIASEGGHADFGPASSREVKLAERLIAEHGRARWEDVVSGPGLSTLHRFAHDRPCTAVPDAVDEGDRPAAISEAALDGRCDRCVDTLTLFASIYGSAAGNLALLASATGGLHVGGGIAPKILPVLDAGGFMAAFRRKAPMDDLVNRIPVRVILNPEAALLGAATALVSS